MRGSSGFQLLQLVVSGSRICVERDLDGVSVVLREGDQAFFIGGIDDFYAWVGLMADFQSDLLMGVSHVATTEERLSLNGATDAA